jgi:carboxypeptidase T
MDRGIEGTAMAGSLPDVSATEEWPHLGIAPAGQARHHRAMTKTRRRLSRSWLGAIVALAGLTVLAPTTALAADEFPKGYEGYHTYGELWADVKAIADGHPTIARRLSIGTSYQGRHLWALMISDNVGVDESEPEVLFDGGTHADEHMTVEMALRIAHWLVDGYGSDSRITNIVNSREIWILFNINPDGSEYDIASGKFHYWRKNRQPTPGTSYIGTDINRNFGYKWGGGGRTSSNPAAITYRGPAPFSTPEARAVRDFLASRVVNGRQQIRTHITFHEAGRLVMWPYGYTYTNVPGDMTKTDHDALVHIGKSMAASNGYKPEQASDLYISSGTTRDYTYGTYRIFSYTFELSNRDYMDDSLIASETGRNKNAVLYLAERAWCPLSVLGQSMITARCGAFDDDVEVSKGWAANPDGTDTATTGRFGRVNPESTSSNGPKQLGTVASGSKAFVTGALAGSSANANDLDGSTSLRSVPISLPSTSGQRLFFRYVFAHGSNSSSADKLVASIEDSGGTRTPVVTLTGSATDVDGAWKYVYAPIDAWAGQSVRIVFQAVDGASNSLVEVEIDDIRITRGT